MFGSPLIEQPDIDEAIGCLRGGWAGTGPKVSQFEAAFADYVGARHAVAVSSCTAALHLSMIAADVGTGDEVITTPMTFVATANAIEHTGATPVFADVDLETMNIDPEKVAEAVTSRTRALLPVDFAGRPVNYTALLSLAENHGLPVVEDAAHCIEGRVAGRKTGAIADATCFSFYVTKNITTIEGGMITTDNDEWAARMRVYALHGMTANAWDRFSDAGFRHYDVVAAGYKYNMTDLNAAIGINQLPRIDAWHARREELWSRYDDAFVDLPIIRPAPVPPGTTHARHLYTVLLRLEQLTATRDQVLSALHAEGVGCGVHYTALHLLDYYRRTYDLRPDDFPNATYISRRTLSIPLSPKLSDADAADVMEAVRRVTLAYKR